MHGPLNVKFECQKLNGISYFSNMTLGA